MLMRIILITITIILLAATPVYASCASSTSGGGLFGLLGLTKITEVAAQRDCQVEYVRGQAKLAVEQAKGDAAVRVQEAQAIVEQVRQQQYASAHQRDIAVAEAEAHARGLIAGIESERDQSVASILGQRDIAVAEVKELGATDRTLITQGNFAKNAFIVGAFIILIILALGWVLVAMKERSQPQAPSVILIEARNTGTLPVALEGGRWALLNGDGSIHRTWTPKIENKVKLLEGEVING